jgi:IstB-like ATP binding protein
MGLEQGERDGARLSGFMQKMLLPRYKEQRSTTVTSNIPWEAWADYLGATALIDRLLHRSHILVISGPSYQDWEHKQDLGGAPLVTASATESAIDAANCLPAQHRVVLVAAGSDDFLDRDQHVNSSSRALSPSSFETAFLTFSS